MWIKVGKVWQILLAIMACAVKNGRTSSRPNVSATVRYLRRAVAIERRWEGDLTGHHFWPSCQRSCTIIIHSNGRWCEWRWRDNTGRRIIGVEWRGRRWALPHRWGWALMRHITDCYILAFTQFFVTWSRPWAFQQKGDWYHHHWSVLRRHDKNIWFNNWLACKAFYAAGRSGCHWNGLLHII